MKRLSTAACLAALALSFGAAHAADATKAAAGKSTEAKAAAKAASAAASAPAAKPETKKKEKKGGC